MDRHTISAPAISATVLAEGAELCSLRDAAGRELLWQAGSEWPRHAPVLFPIVGELAGNRLRHRGRSYEMHRHGFARTRRFTWTERGPSSCRLVLTDDAATRAQYPFAFRFALAYVVADDALTMTFTMENPGSEPLPASFGAHPAFRWPLAEGITKEAHRIEFAQPEPAPIRRLDSNLLAPDPRPTPVEDKVLRLCEALFAEDAIIFDHLASRALRYTAPGAPAIEVTWDEGFAQLGLWMKPGADFLCIEPWHGFADPAGFASDFTEKPGLVHINPGGRFDATMRIRITS
jgi:galactose mutarotase-like enzyme